MKENQGTIILSAEFIWGSDSLTNLPSKGLPEIAFMGRSNVGKSTLINRITSRKQLARSSSTPGRTQQFNFFEVQLRHDGEEQTCLLVDLPGFGYAKYSKKLRESLNRMTVDYLQSREELGLLCLLNDIRRDPKEDELAIQRLAFENQVASLIIATKSDKVKRNEMSKRINKIAEAYHLEAHDLLKSNSNFEPAQFWQRVSLILWS